MTTKNVKSNKNMCLNAARDRAKKRKTELFVQQQHIKATLIISKIKLTA